MKIPKFLGGCTRHFFKLIAVFRPYRKPKHTDRYLIILHITRKKKHKISTAATFLNCASNLPSTTDGKAKEIKHATDVLKTMATLHQLFLTS